MSRAKFGALVGMMAMAVPVPLPEPGHAGGTSGDKGHEHDFGDRESEAPLSQMGIWKCGLKPRGEPGRVAYLGSYLGGGGI